MEPPPDDGFHLLNWWDAMSSSFPVMASQARRLLRIPLTTVEVEGTFSVYKLTRTANQFNMKDDTHHSRISYVVNGIVPAP